MSYYVGIEYFTVFDPDDYQGAYYDIGRAVVVSAISPEQAKYKGTSNKAVYVIRQAFEDRRGAVIVQGLVSRLSHDEMLQILEKDSWRSFKNE